VNAYTATNNALPAHSRPRQNQSHRANSERPIVGNRQTHKEVGRKGTLRFCDAYIPRNAHDVRYCLLRRRNLNWPSFDLKEYARRGATARVSELKAGARRESIRASLTSAALVQMPSVLARAVKAGDGRTRAARAARLASATGSSSVTTTRRRRRMSPAARKAVSERMRKYWAQRRKAKRRQQVIAPLPRRHYRRRVEYVSRECLNSKRQRLRERYQ